MGIATLRPEAAQLLRAGTVIPAHPLALKADLRLDERHQRALTRYYLAAGVGGVAVGVHTTQFEIRDPAFRMLEPVLRITMEEVRAANLQHPFITVAGICGSTEQAFAEASLAAELGYDLGLVSLGGLGNCPESKLIRHLERISEFIPIFGFYLQPAVGGRSLSFGFWSDAAELPGLVAVKIAPFDRYRTLDVIRAVCVSSRRDEIALYTGNDDHIVWDLLTPYRFIVDGVWVEKWLVGGLLGQWAVGTRRAMELFGRIRAARETGHVPAPILAEGTDLTAYNAVVFDAAHSYRGAIAGIQEILYRQGLLAGNYCLNSAEHLSPGQAEEISRVLTEYPHLGDDVFIAAHRDEWLA